MVPTSLDSCEEQRVPKNEQARNERRSEVLADKGKEARHGGLSSVQAALRL